MTTQPLPFAPDEYERRNEQETRRIIENAIQDLERPQGDYTEAAVNPQTRDVSAIATLADTINVLQTLVADLREKGVLG